MGKKPKRKKAKLTLKHLIEGYAKEIVESVHNKTFIESKKSRHEELHVYDFDDTLVSTDSVVYVINKNTNEYHELHPHDFHDYVLGDDEYFDLSGFHTVENPKLLPMFKNLQNDYARLGPRGVAILTARSEAEPIRQFLSKYGMGDIPIVAVGSDELASKSNDRHINARRKRAWLKRQLDKRPIKYLSFYDDNESNILSAKSLQSKYPDVVFDIRLV